MTTEERILLYLGDSYTFLGYTPRCNATKELAKMHIRCNRCGHEFSRVVTTIYTSDTTPCPECKRIELNRHRRVKARRIKPTGISIHINRCVYCGQTFISGSGVGHGKYQRYCTKSCMFAHKKDVSKKKHTGTHSDERIMKCKVRDWSITLEKVYERDKGICWICGKLCDWSDIRHTKRAQIAGERYPSIDHVVPIAKGGNHTWENVRLAHRGCNSQKAAKIYPSP